ncbi:hypothetical protein NDU88_003580 [Pleurodeles waltl]|uniref:Uncharacterized protein n=1 Tax=Pleurodeles waltl TaxID=8319 RepID=A0AAV7RH44_PLEWA|nr:hypothetical protein NDU88_003580 [Pleurodeles waltl]
MRAVGLGGDGQQADGARRRPGLRCAAGLSPVVPGAPEPEGAAQTASILQAIGDLKVTMKGKMGELKVDLTLIRQDL